MKVKKLKKLINEYDDDATVLLQYEGGEIEIEEGDCFRVKDLEYDGHTVMVLF